MPKQAGKGRKLGSKNRGYFFRKSHKVWCANHAGRFVPLLDENGDRIRDRHAAPAVIKEAYARFLVSLPKQTLSTPASISVWDLSKLYLAHLEQTAASSTFDSRAGALFDFCTGLSRRWRTSREQPKAQDYLHKGYGKQAAADLTKSDVDDWLEAHEGWGPGARRMHTQAVRRMLCFGIEKGKLDKNPIRGVKIPKGRPRVTCISPAAEEALMKVSKLQLRTAIYVLIRTGIPPTVPKWLKLS